MHERSSQKPGPNKCLMAAKGELRVLLEIPLGVTVTLVWKDLTDKFGEVAPAGSQNLTPELPNLVLAGLSEQEAGLPPGPLDPTESVDAFELLVSPEGGELNAFVWVNGKAASLNTKQTLHLTSRGVVALVTAGIAEQVYVEDTTEGL